MSAAYRQDVPGDIFAAHRASWQETCGISAEGMRRVDPYLRQISYQGRVVWTSKGPLAEFLQRSIGDAIMATGPDTFAAIELKTERKATGNLFIETWSNKSRGTPGWLWTLNTDLLCYYFLDEDRMYFVDFRRLKIWLTSRNARGQMVGETFSEKYTKRQQLNDTHGRCVPISAIARAGPGYHTVSIMQLEMFGGRGVTES